MADAAVLVFDVIQNILLRLDVEDLLRFKSVCKLWYSLISSNCFVNAHLNHNYNINPDLRILTRIRLDITDRNFCYSEIVGSSNGLVCISSFSVEFCVINPSTREHKALPTLPFKGPWSELLVCWGFGYDSSTDDYKVVVGTKVGDHRIRFQVLTLKSTTWRFIGELNYKYTPAFGYGCSLNGAMHWLMEDLHSNHNSNNNIVILSFDFSQEKFKEIPQPDDTRYVCDYECHLAISKECLVVLPRDLRRPTWVMKKYNDKNSWQMLQDKDRRHPSDVYFLNCFPYNGWRFCDIKGNMCHDRSFNPCLNECWIGHGAPTFVKSLVSPHRYGKPKKKNKRSLKLDSSYHVISSSFFFKNTMRNNKRKKYKKNK